MKKKLNSKFCLLFSIAFLGGFIACNPTSASASAPSSQYMEGKPFNCTKRYPLKTRIILAQKFLSEIEQLLLRNIVVNDIKPANIMISHDSLCLNLVDLEGNELITETEMSVGTYTESIEDMLVSIGGEAARILSYCDHLIPEAQKYETLSLAHTEMLLNWINALQKELTTFNDVY